MRGSFLAEQIEREEKRKKFFSQKKRKKCIIDNQKQCRKCEFQNICDGVEQNTIK